MNMTEGSTTLNVPELRRLLEEERKAKEAWLAIETAAGPPRAADFDGEMTDADDRAFQRWLDAQAKASVAALKAAPALLDAVEAAKALDQVLADDNPELFWWRSEHHDLHEALAPLYPAEADPS